MYSGFERVRRRSHEAHARKQHSQTSDPSAKFAAREATQAITALKNWYHQACSFRRQTEIS